jgi:hypothetical protein
VVGCGESGSSDDMESEVVGESISGSFETALPNGEDPIGGIKGELSSRFGVVEGDDPEDDSPSFLFLILIRRTSNRTKSKSH